MIDRNSVEEKQVKSMMNGLDNCIEFLRDEKRATVTFCQGRYISKIKKYAEQYPDEVQIVCENETSIMAHIPVSYIRINHPRSVSEKQKQIASERFKAMWEEKRGAE